MPHFGSWAGLTLLDGPHLRRVDSAGADDLAGGARPQKVADLGPEATAVLRRAARAAAGWPTPVGVAVLTALAVPPGPAEVLASTTAGLVTVPLSSAAAGDAVLTVVAAEPPPPPELADFATRAARALAAARTYEERTTLARMLREALVPAPLPEIDGLDLGAAYRPAQEASQIGGDFYDVSRRPDGRWSLSIGDVCGKGVEAATLTGQVRQSLRTAAHVTDDPATTLRLLNETLVGADGSTFATATYAVLEPGGDRVAVRLAVGGHPPPLLLRGGSVAPVAVQGTLIGMLDEVRFQTVDLALEPGDVLLFYTDGAIEARGPAGILGVEPVAELLADCDRLTAPAITERIMQLVMEHLHGWAHDDIALLAVRCTES